MSKLDQIQTAIGAKDEQLRREKGMAPWLAQTIEVLQIGFGIALFGLSGTGALGIALKALGVGLALAALGTSIGRWR